MADPIIGIIGAGWVVHNCYVPSFDEVGLKVGAVTDSNIDAGQALANRLNAGTVCSNIDKFLERDVQLVVIATPNIYHAQLSNRVLSTGRNVLCEKPLALSQLEAEQLLTIGGQGRLFLSTPYRFRDDVSALCKLVRDGGLGQVYRVQLIWTRAKGVPRPGSWYTQRQLSGGGVLVDLGSHLLDIGLLLLDWPKLSSVNAWIGHFLGVTREYANSWMSSPVSLEIGMSDVEDQASALFTFAGNRVLELHVSWVGYYGGDRTVIQVEGTQGRAVLKTLFGYSTEPEEKIPSLTVWSKKGMSTHSFSSHRQPATDFGRMLNTIITEQSFAGLKAATGAQAVQVVNLIQRAYEAAGRDTW